MRKLNVVVFFLATTLIVSHASGDQKVARIECPAETKAKIAWPDKVGDDPSFSRDKPPDEWITFGFKNMRQVEQKVTCRYEYTNGSASVYQDYSYTIQRAISGCKVVNARVIDCFLIQKGD